MTPSREAEYSNMRLCSSLSPAFVLVKDGLKGETIVYAIGGIKKIAEILSIDQPSIVVYNGPRDVHESLN